MASIEEKVEEHYKKILDELGIRHYGKTESINRTITDALRSADSKSGGSGNNYPDIQLLLENKTARRIPVMIEAKGLKNRLEKISKSGQIELITYYEKDSKRKDGTIQHHAGDANYSSIMNYAVNGAVHYANAILDSRGYTEVIAIGKQNIRLKAEDVGEKNLYGLYYDYDSSFEHGLWGAIRESSLLKCNNPAHKYHCVPDVEDEARLKTVLPDCIMIMNKTISFLDEIYGIPEQLLNEVINFEIKPIAG